MTHTSTRLSLTLLAAALAFTLSACGDKGDAGGKKIATQVAAKVGSEEISVHQINQVLSRSNNTASTPEAAKAQSRDVLEKLIDQQLAVDQATEAKLNRTPEVVAQIESARREILARAYIQQIATALPKPTAEEAQTYFTEHPELFAQRRIYNVQEVVVATPADDVAAQLRTFAGSPRPLEDAAAWLKGRDIKFVQGNASRAAEQIPLELLKQIYTLKDGQSTLIQSAQGATLVQLVSSQLAPVDLATALPRIEQFLGNQRASDAIAAKIKELRASTKIAYMGDFADTAATLEKGVAGLK